MPHEPTVAVTFTPGRKTVHVLPGTAAPEAAALAGLTIDSPCGGGGTCGKCRVQVVSGSLAPTATEKKQLSPDEIADGWRLACQTKLTDAATIEVPGTSLFAGACRILQASDEPGAVELDPPVQKVFCQLAPPTLEDPIDDQRRLQRELGDISADLDVWRELAPKLRRSEFTGTAVLAGDRLLDFELGDTTSQMYSLAFDIGTTTIVGVLLDLNSGAELAVEADVNPQVAVGDDILSRIQRANESDDGLDELRRVVVERIRDLTALLCQSAGVDPQQVYEAVFSGNTTMQHLLCGLHPRNLGEVPFVSTVGDGLTVSAQSLELPIHPQAEAYIFPVLGGFLGGDTVAGLLTTRLASHEGTALLIDIGTNGEIVLAHNGELIATSAAAGPAFEGARISCGMRAAAGAIEAISYDDDLHLTIIGDVPATGLCGSGLIDLAAVLLESGVMRPEGRILPPDLVPETISAAIRSRVELDKDGNPVFVLQRENTAEGAQRVAVTQRDIRELQLANGAIRAAVNVLLERVGVTAADLDALYVAGGFGSYIRREQAQRIGLLPRDTRPTAIHFVGNVSLAGARWAALSATARTQAEQLATQAEVVELSIDAPFKNQFGETIIFPE